MKTILLQTEPIRLAEFLDQAGTENDGAVVHFVGQARRTSQGRRVLYLEYEVYSGMARRELEKILEQACSLWPLETCLVVHRYGKVEIGEASILISVSSAHRDDAYKASRFIIDEIKKRVPIWKKEFYEDGSSWISETP